VTVIQTPCSDPSNDPNDWFIEKDGKQYRDDSVLPEEQVKAILISAHGHDLSEAEALALVDAAEDEKIRLNLIRRRKARDACYDCPIRLECLGQRLEAKIEFGIWGGYYPEELRKIEDERAARSRRRGGVD
jgi:hypothetical protein